MPAPLFPYTWQYSNQPIEVLAENIVNVISASGNTGSVNTADYIPVSNGLTFDNSWLRAYDGSNNPVIVTEFTASPLEGISLNPSIRYYTLGTFDPSVSAFGLGYADVLNDPTFGSYAAVGIRGSHSVGVNSNTGVELNGSEVSTAGSASGSYLEIWVNGNSYKLELLNP